MDSNKKIILGSICVASIVSFIYFGGNDLVIPIPAEVGPLVPEPSPPLASETGSIGQTYLEQKSTASPKIPALSEEQLASATTRLAAQEAEIQQLMATYEEVKSDPELRKAHLAKMHAKLDVYNETVLPIALQKIAEENAARLRQKN